MDFKQWPMGVGGISGSHSKASVVSGEIRVPEVVVGGSFRRDACQAEFFDEAVLVGAKRAFDTTFSLRGVGADDVNPEFGHGAGELGDGLGVFELFLDRSLAVDRVDGVFVDIKSDRSSVAIQIRLCRGE